MADNNLALGRHDGPDIFADDDPLAELARIVGYEDRSAHPSAPAAAPRREPEFNLEDELMREFERFDAPRLDPANDIGLSPEPVQPSTQRPVSGPAVDDLHAALIERYEPAAQQALSQPPVEREIPLQHLPFDLQTDAPVMPIHRDEPVAPQFENIDLAAELETSLAPQQPAVVPVRPEAPETAKAVTKGYTPGFRMPIANFHRVAETPREPVVEVAPVVPAQASVPAMEPQLAAEPAVAASPVATPDENDSIWSSLERELTGEFNQPEVTGPAPIADDVVEVKPVSIAQVVQRQEEPAVAPAYSQSARVEPAFSPPSLATAPVVAPAPVPAERFSQLEELVYDVDRFSASKPVAQPAAPQAAISPVAPVTKPAAAATDADLIDDDFELALDDLELDLSDLTIGEPEPVAVFATAKPVAAPAAPVVSAPVQASVQYQPRYDMLATASTQRPAVASVAAVPAYVEPAATGPAQFEVAEIDADQFDPAMIADGEEQVEAMVEMDVPEFTVEEPVAVRKQDPDFDIDLDAELANLLQSAAPAAPSLARGTAAQATVSRATPTQPAAVPAWQAPAAAANYDNDLDDFERALEEDFRRSLSTPLVNGGRVSDEDDDGYAMPVARRPLRWGPPAALLGVVLLGGLSAYAYYTSGVPGKASSGMPLVIAADKEPVKVAPENPGGKTVPNQDKAVYDRVAGAAANAPKQESLISSNEEPMDVVQRTLASDNLPLQGEEEAMTDVADTEDARLLPQQAENAAAQPGEQPVSVMPRKVRTMVVRADGTLVEQEVTAPVQTAQAGALSAHPAMSEKIPAQPALAEPTAAPKPVAAAQPATPAPMSAPVAVAPAAPVKVNAPAAPVPAARPAEQPVNVVAAVSDRGNVKPTVKPVAVAPAEVAAASPGGYFVQVASLPSQAEAQKSYQSLSAKFGGVISGRGVDIKAAEIAGKGTFYRVRIPAGSKDQAVQLCEKYRSAGGSCLVAR